MGIGHQFLEQLLLTSAFLGGQFIGYSTFFVLQVIAVCFVLIKDAPGSQLRLSRSAQTPACSPQGCSGFLGQVSRVAVPRLTEIFSISILADISSQYFPLL